MFSPNSAQPSTDKQTAKAFGQSATCAGLVAHLGEKVRGILDGQSAGDLPDNVIQDLLTMAAKLYVAKREAGAQLAPFADHELTATEVVVTTTNMLKAANLEVFELTMWNGFGTM